MPAHSSCNTTHRREPHSELAADAGRADTALDISQLGSAFCAHRLRIITTNQELRAANETLPAIVCVASHLAESWQHDQQTDRDADSTDENDHHFTMRTIIVES